jgi:hypothetical protein
MEVELLSSPIVHHEVSYFSDIFFAYGHFFFHRDNQ